MSYLLHIDVSPMGENSKSRAIGAAFVTAYKNAHVEETVVTRDLAKDPINHVDIELLSAGYAPEGSRPASMQKKQDFRNELIKELVDAKAVVITVPMWNWAIPSVLKAYIDHIVSIGKLDPIHNKNLQGKAVTFIVASGSAYTEGSQHPEWDFITPYLKFLFTSLGSTDVSFINVEYTLAGVVPAMEPLIPAKEASNDKALAAAIKRASEIV